MKHFIFNPEHDLCLADGSGSFIPPAPIVEFAQKCRWVERFMQAGESCLEGEFPAGELNAEEFPAAEEKGVVTEVVPWGWNRCLRDRLIKEGVSREILPDDAQLEFIKENSRRELAQELLEFLHKEGECSGGEEVLSVHKVAQEENGRSISPGAPVIEAQYRTVARSMEEIEAFLQERGRVVLKAPLSGSGKGVRFVSGELMETDKGWCRRTLQRQGAVIVEQRMEIVQEFAMLFELEGSRVQFRGYSLFYASNGAYKGNLLASNEYIEEQLGKYVPVGELRRVRCLVEKFLQEKLQGKYTGFVGVDQFVAESGPGEESSGRKYVWNPAMEINLRMTMGLVARNIYDFHSKEFGLGEATHCFEPEKGVYKL